MELTTIIDLSQLERFRTYIGSGTAPAIRWVMVQWAVRYRAYLQRRYRDLSRGGGEWPPLKRKRKRGKRNAASVLIDTGRMFGALDAAFTGAPGQLEEHGPFSVRVGYGGPGGYESGGPSVAEVAGFHQLGLGNLPVRKTIVPPDQSLANKMGQDMERGLARLLGQ